VSFLIQVVHWFANPAHWHGPDGIPNRVGEHVLMSVVATLAAIAIALPIGLVLGHYGRGGGIAINISNIGRAIPSFALLVLFLQLTGLGAIPAFLALVVLAIPPIVTNGYVGMRNVDQGLLDAAKGIGMRADQILLKVELPTAVPVVMAGVRTAGVQVVATATLAAIVSWGGLGRFIVDGLNNLDYAEVFAGALMVAVLAGIAEILLALLEYVLTPVGLRRVSRKSLEQQKVKASVAT
jgi:osmoprotectant transport system permease protein